MDSGKWIRESREERLVKSSDVERISRAIADVKGNADFYVSHSTLSDIEAGSVPSIHKLFSLAACLKVSLEELLLVFRIDALEVKQFAEQREPGRGGPAAIEAREPGFNFQLSFDTGFKCRETSLLRPNPQELVDLFPLALGKCLDPRRYRYAIVGSKDDTMGDLVPPGSVVEVDPMQNAIQVSDWKTIRERPIYLVLHANEYNCCWCQLEGKELTLLPYPLSRQPARRFKVPREASVIGRVINAWLPFDQNRSFAKSAK